MQKVQYLTKSITAFLRGFVYIFLRRLKEKRLNTLCTCSALHPFAMNRYFKFFYSTIFVTWVYIIHTLEHVNVSEPNLKIYIFYANNRCTIRLLNICSTNQKFTIASRCISLLANEINNIASCELEKEKNKPATKNNLMKFPKE